MYRQLCYKKDLEAQGVFPRVFNVFKKVYLINSYIKSQKRRNIVEMVNSSIGPLKKVCQIPEYNAFCMIFSKRMFSVFEHVLTQYILPIDIQIILMFYFAHKIYFSTFQITLP